MDMSMMTLKDFITESENFEHSKEYYDFLKEAHEISLMGLYLRNHEYLTENTDASESVVSLFTEATGDKVSDDKVNTTKEKFTAKLWNALKKFLTMLTKPILAIVSAIKAFIKKVGQNTGKAILNRIKNIRPTALDKDVKEFIEECRKENSRLVTVLMEGKRIYAVPKDDENMAAADTIEKTFKKGFMRNLAYHATYLGVQIPEGAKVLSQYSQGAIDILLTPIKKRENIDLDEVNDVFLHILNKVKAVEGKLTFVTFSHLDKLANELHKFYSACHDVKDVISIDTPVTAKDVPDVMKNLLKIISELNKLGTFVLKSLNDEKANVETANKWMNKLLTILEKHTEEATKNG